MASILSNILPLLQSHDVFTSALNQTIDLHNEALEQNERQFQIMKDMEISQHEEEMQVEWKIHCAEVAHNIELARRESIRDVWSQRTQLIQTVMIVDSLIFGSAFSLLVEGNPPNNVPEAVTILYAILIALSLDCIFLSLWLAFIVQARMSRYNMHDPHLRYVCGLTHLTFGDYYKCHCLGLWRLVLAMFYIGTVLTLISSSILLFTKFQYSYMHTAGATIFVAIVGTTVLLVPFGEYLWPSNTRRTNFSSEDFRPSAHPNSYYKASRSTKNGDSSSYPFTEEQNPGVDSSTLSDASGLEHSTKRNSFQFEDDESNWSPARHQRSVQSVTPRLCTSSESTRGADDWTPPGTSPEISEVGTPRPPRLIIPIYSHT